MLKLKKHSNKMIGNKVKHSNKQRLDNRTPLFQNEEKFQEYQIKKKVLTNEEKEKIRKERASEEKKIANQNNEILQNQQKENNDRRNYQQNNYHRQYQQNGRPQQKVVKQQNPLFVSKPKPSHKYYFKSDLLNQFGENWLAKNSCLKGMAHVKNLKSKCNNQVIPVLPKVLTDVVTNLQIKF